MKNKMLAALAVALLAGAFSTHANAITIDPDDYAIGTNLTNIVPGVTLSWLTGNAHGETRSDVYAATCRFPCYEASGPGAFGDAGGAYNAAGLDDYSDCYPYPSTCYRVESYTLLEITFSSPVGFIEFSDAHHSDQTYLIAFDSGGNQLGCYTVFAPGSVCNLSETPAGSAYFDDLGIGSLFRPQSDIARVVFGSWDAFSTISELRYRVPEPGTLALLGLGLAGLGFARRRKLT